MRIAYVSYGIVIFCDAFPSKMNNVSCDGHNLTFPFLRAATIQKSISYAATYQTKFVIDNRIVHQNCKYLVAPCFIRGFITLLVIKNQFYFFPCFCLELVSTYCVCISNRYLLCFWFLDYLFADTIIPTPVEAIMHFPHCFWIPGNNMFWHQILKVACNKWCLLSFSCELW